MARQVAWRRTVSDTVSWRQDQANNATIYILRQFGPMGFLLKEDGETKNFKVFLGDCHQCTCPVFRKEKDLCKHICWVILKRFRIPRDNPITWQLGLVEREINEILQGILARQEARTKPAAQQPTTPGGAGVSGDNGTIPQREITEEDVCPICQEELLAKHQPVTYCRFGCGNNIHIKCMKVWAEHQKSSGESSIKCPMCRVDFGSLAHLLTEFRNTSVHSTHADRMHEHLGVTCRECSVCPVTGKCYKCSVCANFHLCQTCFNTPIHVQHAFQFRLKSTQRWRPAPERARVTGSGLPDAVVDSLMTRDIRNDDYDLLLQLDSSQLTSDLTPESVQSLPLERVAPHSRLLAPGQQCRVCLRPYTAGDTLRRLPCRHRFHRECIDQWLLHRHPTCPVDGVVYSNSSIRETREAQRLMQNIKSESEHGKENIASEPDVSRLHIPGIGLVRQRSTSLASTAAEQLPRRPGLHGNRPSRRMDTVEAIVRQAVFGVSGQGMVQADGIAISRLHNQLNLTPKGEVLPPAGPLKRVPVAPSIPLPHDASLADVSAKHFGLGVTGGASGHPPQCPGRTERPRSDHSEKRIPGTSVSRQRTVDRRRDRSSSANRERAARPSGNSQTPAGGRNLSLQNLYIGNEPDLAVVATNDFTTGGSAKTQLRRGHISAPSGVGHHGNGRTEDPYRWGNTMEFQGDEMMLAGSALSDMGT